MAGKVRSMNMNVHGLASTILEFNSDSSGVDIKGNNLARLTNEITTIIPQSPPEICLGILLLIRLMNQKTIPSKELIEKNFPKSLVFASLSMTEGDWFISNI